MLDHEQYDIRTALVLGAASPVGSAIAAALTARGWRVRGLSHDPDLPWLAHLSPFAWAAGNALDRGDVVQAARGAQLIVDALDLPTSRDKVSTLQKIDNAIVAARLAGGTRILLPAPS